MIRVPRSRRRWRERGFALLLVLWGLILIGLIAASFQRETRVGTALARNAMESAKAEALADAGVERAILALLDPNPATAWRCDGRRYLFEFGGGVVTVHVQDEGGKIDLNYAQPTVLMALFQATGDDAAVARKLTDAILDYADRDSIRRPAGAEDTDYAATGLSEGAKDAPFERKEELLSVLGMNRAIYDAIASSVTVYSGKGDINLSTAPELVLRTIPGLAARQRDQIIAARSGGVPSPPPHVDTVTIVADATTSGGGRFIREAVARRSGEPGNPFQILSWRQSWPAASP
jgi:general secretion pathway protein K